MKYSWPMQPGMWNATGSRWGQKCFPRKMPMFFWECRTCRNFSWNFWDELIYFAKKHGLRKKNNKKHPCRVGFILGNPQLWRPVHFDLTDDVTSFRWDTNKPRAGNIMQQQIQILQFCTNSEMAVWGLYTRCHRWYIMSTAYITYAFTSKTDYSKLQVYMPYMHGLRWKWTFFCNRWDFKHGSRSNCIWSTLSWWRLKFPVSPSWPNGLPIGIRIGNTWSMDHPKDQPLCLVDWTSRDKYQNEISMEFIISSVCSRGFASKTSVLRCHQWLASRWRYLLSCEKNHLQADFLSKQEKVASSTKTSRGGLFWKLKFVDVWDVHIIIKISN